MSNKTKNEFSIKFEKAIDSYMDNFIIYMPVSKNTLLKDFKNYCNALSAVEKETAKKIIDYGKNWCNKWLKYQVTQDNSFVIHDTDPRIKKELPMYVDDKKLRIIFFNATQGQVRPVEKYPSQFMISVPAKEHEDANRAWLSLHLTKHQLALNYLELGYSGNEKKINKKKEIRSFAGKFVDNLLGGNFMTSTEVNNALQKIEPDYKPISEKQKKLLDDSGSPIEINICIALKAIFEIKHKDLSVHWTTARNAFRDINKPISKG